LILPPPDHDPASPENGPDWALAGNTPKMTLAATIPMTNAQNRRYRSRAVMVYSLFGRNGAVKAVSLGGFPAADEKRREWYPYISWHATRANIASRPELAESSPRSHDGG
jgi:hypothetical protein